jgi:hypothetical protein
LSVALITPLTVYFLDYQREKRLVPVRESFIDSLSTSIESIATAHLHYVSLHYLEIQGLQATLAVDMMAAVTTKANEFFETTIARIAHAPAPEFEDKESIVYKLFEKTKSMAKLTERQYDVMYRETQDIENTLTFAMPQFPVEAVIYLHRIIGILMEYREGLRAMIAVLNGVSDPTTVAKARFSVLNFRDLLAAFASVRQVCRIGDRPISLRWATEMAAPTAMHQQSTFAGQLVDLFQQARDADSRLGLRQRVSNV